MRERREGEGKESTAQNGITTKQSMPREQVEKRKRGREGEVVEKAPVKEKAAGEERLKSSFVVGAAATLKVNGDARQERHPPDMFGIEGSVLPRKGHVTGHHRGPPQRQSREQEKAGETAPPPTHPPLPLSQNQPASLFLLSTYHRPAWGSSRPSSFLPCHHPPPHLPGM